ncbi:class I adenylate-forming enzyme family protein [Euzebya pacifica]|uniref:class I adenylate-forming enzyme family protein n=1 Tax=Euzebya pacifica TaxID=1608957 RepID=UPI000DF73545|nr:AMP-binding protein [Euzebya pacifica]
MTSLIVGDIPRRNARRFPHKSAVVCEDRTLSWAAVDERANRLATALLESGLRAGDRVVVCARNCLEWPEIVFGLAKAGLVLVPINTRLAVDEVAHALATVEPGAAIVHRDQSADLGEAFADPLLPALVIGGSELGRSYDTALTHGRATDPTPTDLRGADPRTLLFTSGTTGRPKAAIHSHEGMMLAALDHLVLTGGTHDDVCLAATPFFTAGGMMRTLNWTHLGQTMVVMPRFDEAAALDLVQRHQITTTIMVPTMLARVLDALTPDHDTSSLRLLGYGSAPVPTALAEEATERFGVPLFQQYGSTETGGLVTFLSPDHHRRALHGEDHLLTSCGVETPLAEIRIMAEPGVEAEAGALGEIAVRAPSVAHGYWGNPQAWEASTDDGWLLTGDVGRRDEEGLIYLVDRKNDMIVSGAFNVYPAEIERVLTSDPRVRLAAVIGVEDHDWGERPVAYVVPRQGADVDGLAEELRLLCRVQLAGYKQPREVHLRNDLPITAAGKILRRALREPTQVH